MILSALWFALPLVLLVSQHPVTVAPTNRRHSPPRETGSRTPGQQLEDRPEKLTTSKPDRNLPLSVARSSSQPWRWRHSRQCVGADTSSPEEAAFKSCCEET